MLISSLVNHPHSLEIPCLISTKNARKVWEEAFGPIPVGLVVRHRCDNPPCKELCHLQLGTVQDNHQDMVDRDRTTRGERSWNTKLTDRDVLNIRYSYDIKDVRVSELAKRFYVSSSAITAIVTRKTWKHI
jgi:hypothetical protein